jgi:UPF0271 protein
MSSNQSETAFSHPDSYGDPSKRGESVDLNCDMGEGMGNDEDIMPWISSTNIACGYHAGDEQTIWKTIELALRYNVAIGAHVSLLDKENFGRVEMKLPAAEIYDLIIQQLIIIGSFELKLHHVKPHGALYNMSAKDPSVAKAIAGAVKDFNADIILYGLSNSHSISEAGKIDLKTASEAFADRTYQDDGRLTPRSVSGSLIEDGVVAAQQVLQMIREKTVTSVSGKKVPLMAQTICIHGDGKNAAAMVKAIHQSLKQQHIAIETI